MTLPFRYLANFVPDWQDVFSNNADLGKDFSGRTVFVLPGKSSFFCLRKADIFSSIPGNSFPRLSF